MQIVALVESVLKNPQPQAVIALAGEATLIFCKAWKSIYYFLAFFATLFLRYIQG